GGGVGLGVRGRVQGEVEEGKAGASAYRLGLAQNPDAEGPLLALIRLAWDQKEHEEMLDHLRRYTLVAGNDLEGLATAAEWHLRLQRYEDAFELASRAREVGFHAKAQRVLGLVYLHRGDSEKA